METATFDEQSLASGHILLTILNKSFSHVSCKAGVQSKRLSVYIYILPNDLTIRCTADSSNLDGKGGRQSHELTEAAMAAFDEQTLWFDYGIVAGVMVCAKHHSHQLSLIPYSLSAVYSQLSPRRHT